MIWKIILYSIPKHIAHNVFFKLNKKLLLDYTLQSGYYRAFSDLCTKIYIMVYISAQFRKTLMFRGKYLQKFTINFPVRTDKECNASGGSSGLGLFWRQKRRKTGTLSCVHSSIVKFNPKRANSVLRTSNNARFVVVSLTLMVHSAKSTILCYYVMLNLFQHLLQDLF